MMMRAGFTLIELLLVLVLIGLAVALLLPRLMVGQRSSAAQAFSIELAQYLTDTGYAALNREQTACVSRQGRQFVTSGLVRKPLELPTGVDITPQAELCFDRSGKLIGSPVSLTVTQGDTVEAHVRLTPGYGTAEVTP